MEGLRYARPFPSPLGVPHFCRGGCPHPPAGQGIGPPQGRMPPHRLPPPSVGAGALYPFCPFGTFSPDRGNRPHPPGLTALQTERKRGFRLRASSFCSGAKGTKRPPGAAHGHLTMPYPAATRTPFIFTGEPSRRRAITCRRGKRPGCVSKRQPLPLRVGGRTSCSDRNHRACLSALPAGSGGRLPLSRGDVPKGQRG